MAGAIEPKEGWVGEGQAQGLQSLGFFEGGEWGWRLNDLAI